MFFISLSVVGLHKNEKKSKKAKKEYKNVKIILKLALYYKVIAKVLLELALLSFIF